MALNLEVPFPCVFLASRVASSGRPWWPQLSYYVFWRSLSVIFALVSVVVSVMFGFSISRAPRQGLVLRQLKHLAFATSLFSAFLFGEWSGNLYFLTAVPLATTLGDHLCGLLLIMRVSHCITRVWGALLYAHITFGLLSLSRHDIPRLRCLGRSLKVLPLAAILASLCLLYGGTNYDVNTHSCSWPVGVWVCAVEMIVIFVVVCASTAIALRRSRNSAPNCVFRRLACDSFLFFTVFLTTNLIWAVSKIGMLYFESSRTWRTYVWMPSELLQGLHGTFEALAYMHFLQRHRHHHNDWCFDVGFNPTIHSILVETSAPSAHQQAVPFGPWPAGQEHCSSTQPSSESASRGRTPRREQIGPALPPSQRSQSLPARCHSASSHSGCDQECCELGGGANSADWDGMAPPLLSVGQGSRSRSQTPYGSWSCRSDSSSNSSSSISSSSACSPRADVWAWQPMRQSPG
eukprot:NODE_5031_length_1817_cov_7.510059.p1 GENE.NODE_5031_length_1817_cov_7.510059~~NODE_5031_length_1817_cov_7.510059.p1  ORF type:complete len:462 (+),score=18.16 NODE_5031_length_1817_cov_7.510059:104-1489(+)